MIDIPQNTYALAADPLKGYSPSDVRLWLQKNTTEKDLAEALSQVVNKTGYLMHDLDDANDDSLVNEYRQWRELEKELYSKVIMVLEEENIKNQATHITTGIGLHYIVLPFMVRNGYRDGGGWWIKNWSE